MGFCNYYSGYVRMYAELSGPLHKMLQVGKFDGRKGSKKKLAWTPDEAVPRTPWLGQGIQPVSGPLTLCTEGKTGLRSTNPMYGRRPWTPGASPARACSVP